MSRSGTTKTQLRNRRGNRDKKARLIVLIRRCGIILCASALAAWLGAWLFLDGAFGKATSHAWRAFAQTAAAHGFRVEKILVEGRVNTDPDLLRGLLAVQKDDPLFAFDPHEAQDLIGKIPWVKAVRVERRLPDTIHVVLTERRPLALWQSMKKLRLVDSEGVTLTDTGLERFHSLILIAGDGAPVRAAALISMLEAEPLLKDRVEAATWIGGRRWDIRLKGGISVSLPEDDPAAALRRVALAQEKDGILDQEIVSVDVRENDRLIVRARSGAAQKYEAAATEGDSI